MIEQLVLVRHGQTVHNVAGIAQGWNDSALSDAGRRQVETLAGRIVSLKPDAIFSSSLERALTTARVIAAAAGLDVQVLDDLREMSYGDWEGRQFLDIRRDDEAAYRSWIDDPDSPCPGGESHNAVLRRMQRAFETISAGARRPVAVTHGTAIRIGATALLDAPIAVSRHLAQDNAAINVFVRRGERLVLKLWNDTTHCNDDGER
ncbi:MAG TPA: histidine phosphatase family protein [Thermoanaerobaculia bacterium]|nr:histidine phosphatase family protein [Thermoanaerobaculia bacterium]